jgi:murein DD-endopeptidase MepM/ murein hydrolase activator NlpD
LSSFAPRQPRPRTRTAARAAAAALILLTALGAAPDGRAEEIRRRFGAVTVVADTRQAQPGGVLLVRFLSSARLGALHAVFEGRKSPAYWSRSAGLHALVPIPVTTPPGEGLLGIEVSARRGLQRLRMSFPIGARAFASREQTIPEAKRALLAGGEALRDGRRLMQALRTLTPKPLWEGVAFEPPVLSPPADSFGARESWLGAEGVEDKMDGGFGDFHRGRDYPLAPGAPVRAPAGGHVVMATTLRLSGRTLVLDHGRGIVSAFYHLGRLDVREGQTVARRQLLGASGDSGLASFPHLHWGIYLHGIPVDPLVVVELSKLL